MVLCVIALIVFSVLGIFSAKYRSYAKDAFHCVSRMITLRPCETGFDQKLKMKIVTKTHKLSPRVARGVYRHFKAFSWIFVLSMVLSAGLLAQGVYNYAVYGNCNGPHDDGFCIFNPAATGQLSCGSEHCGAEGCECGPKDTNCTQETGYAPCEGDCDCFKDVCG